MRKRYIIVTVFIVCLLGIFIGSWLTKDFLNNGFDHDTKAKKVSRPIQVGISLNQYESKGI